jgi:NAD(P)-dependent dehydrogenase (short-subunit alcohol dehydrogenase family)
VDLLPFSHDDRLFSENLVLNLVSAWWTTQEALPHMRERRHGRVLFIGSGYAKRSGGLVAYTAAKHGLVGLTRALAAQVAPFGITVNCLCPGWTHTRLVDWDALAVAYGTDAAGARARAEADNLQHRVLEPAELGPMAALLAADESAGITGQVISVDGGFGV